MNNWVSRTLSYMQLKKNKKTKNIKKTIGRFTLIVSCIGIGALYMYLYSGYNTLVENISQVNLTGSVVQETGIRESRDILPATSSDTDDGEKVSSIEKLIRDKWDDETEDIAVAIAMAESHHNPQAVGDHHMPAPSVGLFQINQYYHPHYDNLTDAQTNITAAKEIYEASGFRAWSTYKNGAYLQYM